MQAARQLAQLGCRLTELTGHLLHELSRLGGVGLELCARQPQVERQRDQPLLGAIVEVALDPQPLGVGGGDDATP